MSVQAVPLNSFAWFSGGVVNYRRPDSGLVDWLCVRIDPEAAETERIVDLQLREDSHHYYIELHSYDEQGAETFEAGLDWGGPFEVGLGDLAGPHTVLARVVFLPYSIPPVRAEELVEVHCGTLTRGDGTVEPLLIQVSADPSTVPPPHFHYASDVYASDYWGLDEIPFDGPVPLVSLKRNAGGSPPFFLRRPVPATTRVYLLNEQNFDPSFAPGHELAWERLPPDASYLDVPAMKYAPAAATQLKTWVVALPVMRLDDVIGRIGFPLAKSDLIKNLRLAFVGANLWAEWNWGGLRDWVSVELSWDVKQDQNYAGQRDGLTVSYIDYQPHQSVLLFPCNPTLYGWTLEVVATPYVLGKAQIDQTLTKEILL